MGWAYQINVMAAFRLKGKHYPGQFLLIYCDSLTQLTYGVVLAEKAPQVAVGKEDSSRAVPTHKRRFLSKVSAPARNHYLAGNMTLATFTSQAIYPALTRAKAAFFQYCFGFLRPSL